MRLIDLCDGALDVPSRYRDLEISGLSCDSRQLKNGELFVAIRGAESDGHGYARAAVRRGAVAVIGEQSPSRPPLAGDLGVPYFRVSNAREALGRLASVFHGRPSESLGVVGVTGTKGKTTTTWLLDGILRICGKRPALFGTVENRFAERAEPSRNTTPGSLELQEGLRAHLDAGGSHAVLEVSSHAIDQRRIEGICFAGAVFTNLAPEHLDYHGNFEDYCSTKRAFFEELPGDAFAVLSRDDPQSRRIAERTRASIHWYGSDASDGVEGVRIAPDHVEFRWAGLLVRSPVVGHHNLLNLLAAMTAAWELGIDRLSIAEAAADLRVPPGRLEEVWSDSFRVIVDYAHTDGSLEAVLGALRPVTPGRLITIFGCGGDRDRTKRPRMARVAEMGSDQVIITSDNPRTEEPSRIIEDAAAGLASRDAAELVEDRREAIALAIRMARPGDVVLIAGKGHETYQEIGKERIHFDDREVAREVLGQALGATRHATG